MHGKTVKFRSVGFGRPEVPTEQCWGTPYEYVQSAVATTVASRGTEAVLALMTAETQWEVRKKQWGHRHQTQIKASWKDQLLFWQNFKIQLFRACECMWIMYFKVPGRCGFECLFCHLLAVSPWARNLNSLEPCFLPLQNEHRTPTSCCCQDPCA